MACFQTLVMRMPSIKTHTPSAVMVLNRCTLLDVGTNVLLTLARLGIRPPCLYCFLTSNDIWPTERYAGERLHVRPNDHFAVGVRYRFKFSLAATVIPHAFDSIGGHSCVCLRFGALPGRIEHLLAYREDWVSPLGTGSIA